MKSLAELEVEMNRRNRRTLHSLTAVLLLGVAIYIGVLWTASYLIQSSQEGGAAYETKDPHSW